MILQLVIRVIQSFKDFWANMGPQYVLPQDPAHKEVDPHIVTYVDRESYLSEQYKALCGKINALSTRNKHVKSCLLTSSQPEEGKTTTACNIAYTFATSFKLNTILIDADLRRPRVHSMWKIEQLPGLTDYLKGDMSYEFFTLQPLYDRLWVIPSGSIVEDPSPLLNTERWSDLLKNLRRKFDRIVIDAPPVLRSSDAQILGQHTDAVFYVVRAGSTPASQIEEGFKLLEGTTAAPKACVLTAAHSAPDYFSYLTNYNYRRHYYGKYASYRKNY